MQVQTNICFPKTPTDAKRKTANQVNTRQTDMTPPLEKAEKNTRYGRDYSPKAGRVSNPGTAREA